MKLLRLTLTNFKGIKALSIEPQGNNVKIWGDNGTGKTSIADSIMWLLFGKDSGNKSTFDIKTLTPDGQPIHNLEHSVEAEFLLNGKPLLLKKVFKEVWTRKRGTATDVHTGHTTDHFIHGVPASAREYTDKIASICDEDTFKLLTSPTYFNTELHWQKRREVLLQVCGDVSDADVIASSKELAELPKILGDHSMDELKKIIKAQKTAINKELEKIPVRIDEAERGLPDTQGFMEGHIISEKAQLTSKLEAKQAEITRIKNGGEVAEKTKQLREVEARLLDIRNKYRTAVDEAVAGKRKEQSEAKNKYHDLLEAVKRMERTRDGNCDRINDLEQKITALRADWHKENEREFTYEQDESCPACGQALPEEKLNDAREKALAEFNRRKAERLEAITGGGKLHRKTIDELMAENEAITNAVTEKQAEMDNVTAIAEKLRVEIDAITAGTADPTTSPEYKKALAAKEKLDEEISDLQMGDRELLTMAQEEADSIKGRIQAVDDDLQKLRMREQGEARIKELAAEEKRLAAEYEQLEKDSFLMEQFERAQAGMIESKVNGRFKHATFRLFTQNINGSIEPTCDTLYNGVPYNSGLNKGHQGIVGLDIIATLCEFYQFWPPIIYDNAESVTRLPEMKNQMICLYVSEKDKQLRVDVEGEQNTLFGEE